VAYGHLPSDRDLAPGATPGTPRLVAEVRAQHPAAPDPTFDGCRPLPRPPETLFAFFKVGCRIADHHRYH